MYRSRRLRPTYLLHQSILLRQSILLHQSILSSLDQLGLLFRLILWGLFLRALWGPLNRCSRLHRIDLLDRSVLWVLSNR